MRAAWAAFLGLCVLLALAEQSARSLDVPPAGFEDIRAWWATHDRAVFVPNAQGRLETDPELVRLDNNRAEFAALPDPGVYRIFCIGGSTTAGWPYHPRGGYPNWLRAYLADLLPGRKVEILNAGIHAFPSSRNLNVLKEVLAYHPRLLIVLDGYNDPLFYAGRHSSLPFARWVVAARTGLARRSSLYNFIRWRLRLRSARTEPDFSRLPRDALLKEYRGNLEAMAALARGGGSDILFLSLPYSTQVRPNPSLIELYRAMNSVLADVAARERLPLADAAGALPPGDFVDGLHPDLEGYRRVAWTAARAISGLGWIVPQKEWRWSRVRAKADYERELGLADPRWLCHLHVRLGLLALDARDPKGAEAEWAQAERLAENGRVVLAEIGRLNRSDCWEVLAAAERRAGYPERAARALQEAGISR